MPAVHPHTDQAFDFIDGLGEAELDGETTAVRANEMVFVRVGAREDLRNTGDCPLRLITIVPRGC